MTLRPLARSLSARLLVLTIFFVMLSEVLIYAPSIGRFRLTYLQDRLADAHIAALALEATPERSVGPDLEMQLLHHVGAYGVELRLGDIYTLMLGGHTPPEPDARFDLAEGNFFSYILEAFVALAQTENRVLFVTGPSPADPAATVELILDEAPMRAEMIDYSKRILQLSIVISLLTATLVYLSLRWLMVRPMARLTESMVAFREEPRDESRVIRPSGRRDEIGVAEQELAQMQAGLRSALRQRERLAALGEAVTKINHDLRNVLASAQLLSDRLALSNDPEVRRVTPTLFGAIDRAVALCQRVLEYARAGAPNLRLQTFGLRELVSDAGIAVAPATTATDAESVTWLNGVSADFDVVADRDQLYRVLVNLGRNAIDAGASRVMVSATRLQRGTAIAVADDGPGIPEKARDSLFRPFAGSSKADGSGLGLAIARELMHAHGGEITLEATGTSGTTFRLDLPERRAG